MVIGVDLGGTNLRGGIEDQGQVFNFKRELFDNRQSLEGTLMQLIRFVRPLMHTDVKGIGIGVPSVVDVEKGVVFNVANIPSWERVPLKDIMEDEFGVPVCVNNDVNCFALGEHQFGAAKGFRNIVGVSSGTGLGAGIIINNRIFHGNNCGAGEIGLLPYLDHNIEYYASGNLFSVFYNTTAEEAHHLASEGNVEALISWREFGMHLGEALKCVLYAYDPEVIVLGGSLSKAYGFFKDGMNKSLQGFAYPESLKRVHIFQSVNANVTLLGAAALVDIYADASLKA